jgi:hypothetical protein
LKTNFGFTSGPGNDSYTHPKFDHQLVFSTPGDLARYLCKHGIPDYNEKKHEIAPKLRKQLLDWVCRAYVPSDIDDLTLLSDEKCLLILAKLGWVFHDEEYYAPWSDEDRENRIEGVHVFKGIDNLRLFLRSTEHLGGVGKGESEAGVSRTSRRGVSSDEIAAIRVWAAAVPLPLPTFGEQSVGTWATGRTGRMSRRLAEQGPCSIQRKQRKVSTSGRPSAKVRTTEAPQGSTGSAILSVEESLQHAGVPVDSGSTGRSPSPDEAGNLVEKLEDSLQMALPVQTSCSKPLVEYDLMEARDGEETAPVMSQQCREAHDEVGPNDAAVDQDDVGQSENDGFDGMDLDISFGSGDCNHPSGEDSFSPVPFASSFLLTQQQAASDCESEGDDEVEDYFSAASSPGKEQ